MRILICNWKDLAHAAAGGAEVYTHECARRWAAWGHRVTLACSAVPGRPDIEVVDGVRIVRQGTRLGVYSAVRRNTVLDHLATVTVFLGQAMPVFWTGIMLMLLFAVQWRLLPVSGWDSWASMVLPAVTLGAFTTPLFMRIVRSSMLEVINLDYVRTARAKGVSEWLVVFRHALRNAALPIVTVIGLQFGLLLGGAVLTESVFAVPGVGRLIVGAIRQLDFPIVQAGVFMLAIIIVIANFLVDVLYVYLNPTVRLR